MQDDVPVRHRLVPATGFARVVVVDIGYRFGATVGIVLSLTLFRRDGFALLRDDCGLEFHAARHGQRQFNVGVA